MGIGWPATFINKILCQEKNFLPFHLHLGASLQSIPLQGRTQPLKIFLHLPIDEYSFICYNMLIEVQAISARALASINFSTIYE